MKNKIVVAVIGCGRIANIAHFPALTQIENVRIKYACDIIKEKADKIKEEYPTVENVITDYIIALQDPEVDAVYVLTPNFSHYSIAMDALKYGKNVFCEKPITINYELSLNMAKEAEKANKILNIGVCNRFNRSVEMLKELNDKGKFGEIYHIYCSFRNIRSIPGLGGPFTTKEQSGGGVLIDWGVHFLDLILYILGDTKLKSLSCDTYSEMAKTMSEYRYNNMWAEDTSDIQNGINDVEDYVSGYIRTDKASISFNGAWAQNIPHDEMYIDFMGSKCGARLTYGDKFEIFDGSNLQTSNPEYDIPNMYLCEDKSFINSVDTGVKDRNYISNVLQTAKLLDGLYLSSVNKEEIKL